MAPILFNCYTSDIPTDSVEAFLYADDATFLSPVTYPESIEDKLQPITDLVTDYYKWHLKINVQKCQTVLYQVGPHLPNINIQINGAPIPPGDTFKYLVVQLDRLLTFKRHCKALQSKDVEKGQPT